MKKNEHAGIRISARKTALTTKEKLLQLGAVLVLLICFAAGLFGVIAETASLQLGFRFCLALAVFAAACGAGLWLTANGKALWLAAAVLLIIGICLSFSGSLRVCAAPILNGILTRQQQVQGRIHLAYAAAGDLVWAVLAATVLLGFIAAALYSAFPWAAALPLAAGWILAAMGYLQGGFWLILMSLSCVLLLAIALRRQYFGKKTAAFMQAAVVSIALLAAGGAILHISAVAERIPVDGARHIIEKTAHELRYGGAEASFPEGDFTHLGEKPQTKDEMFRIRFSEPSAMWLRGFVGQSYSERGWEAISGSTLSESAELFYWLHKTGFFGQSQLETAASLLGTDLTVQTAEVEMLKACRENLLIPYGITTDNNVLRPEQIGDETVRSARFAGEKQYTYSFVPGLEAQAYAILAQLDEHLEDPALQDYLQQENHYRSFVYQQYLAVPEQTRQTIREFLGEPPEAITSYEAKQTIRNTLKQAAEYDDELGLSDGDPVTAFLKGQGGGWAAQYATAAVMMLRYYGIPARYVEGYLIPEGKTAQIVTLTGEDAHAWAEYYEDGLGWIPFEVTPPYLGVMAESDWQWFERDKDAKLESTSSEDGMLGESAHQSKRPSAPKSEQEQQMEQQMEQQVQSQQNNRLPKMKKINWLWLLLILPLALAAAIMWIVLRRKKALEKRRVRMENEDAAIAIGAMFAHSMQLMWHSGLQKENGALAAKQQPVENWLGEAGDYAQMQALNDEALFSCHSFDAKQREKMVQFRQQVLTQYQSKLKPMQKLYQKWILCMY